MSHKICFLAPSGYGKSTASEFIKSEFNASVVKIAKPLYELQSDFYKKIGIEIGDRQDGELLQFYGYKIRKENPEYLLHTFYDNVSIFDSEIIINDDCRPMDYEALKEMGFVFVKINGYKRDRDDHVKADDKSSLEWQDSIPYDYELDNYGSIEEYKQSILELINRIKSDKHSLILGGNVLC